jgi:hypothetical protein
MEMKEPKSFKRETLTILSEISQILSVVVPVVIGAITVILANVPKKNPSGMNNYQWIQDFLPYLKATAWICIGVGFFFFTRTKRKVKNESLKFAALTQFVFRENHTSFIAIMGLKYRIDCITAKKVYNENDEIAFVMKQLEHHKEMTIGERDEIITALYPKYKKQKDESDSTPNRPAN